MGGHQLSLLATITLAWAAIYAYVGLYSLTLHGYRAGERELRPFAAATFGMMIYAGGVAMFADTDSTAGACLAFQVAMLGAAVAAPAFIHFAYALTERPAGVVVRVGYGIGIACAIANLSGLMIDPSMPATPHPMLIQGFAVPLLPQPTLAYSGAAGFALVAIVGSAWLMRTSAGDPTERFWLWLTGGLLSVAAVHDALINFVPVRSIYLLEHCYLLCALAMTHHLLGRVARTDRELARRTEQLNKNVLDLQRTESELAHKEQLAAVGELSAIIAQEVRNPIAIMRNALSALHQPIADDVARRVMLNIVDQESDRLNLLVGDLLSYAKPLHAQFSSIVVTQLVDRALNTIAPAAHTTLHIHTRIAPEPSTVDCDPELLHQALRNVIDNARAAMHGAGTLSIETALTQHRGEDALRMSISDTGEGIQPSDEAHVREAFFTTRTAGTGLGLAIVDRVLRAHQGHVEIRSRSEGGTTIVLTLPVRADTASETKVRASSPPARSALQHP